MRRAIRTLCIAAALLGGAARVRGVPGLAATPNGWYCVPVALAMCQSAPAGGHATDAPPRPAFAHGETALAQTVQAGIDALRKRIVVRAEVQYRARRGEPAAAARGRVLARSAGSLRLQVDHGGEVTIPLDAILRIQQSADVDADLPEPNNGGPAALLAYTLLAAGVRADDAWLGPLLTTLETHPLPGTYARGLRAAVYARRIEHGGSAAERGRLRRLLNNDVRWLMNAMKANGYYSYDLKGVHRDNSVTQLANLGMWAASDAFAEVPGAYWRGVERHWLESQHADGGWAYAPQDGDSRPSMTVAGANSLYLVLDRRYPKLERPYVRFRGAAAGEPLR